MGASACEGMSHVRGVKLSYSHGASATPLLGETIGANLRRMAAAHPATPRPWSTCRPAGAGPTPQFDADTDTLARGLLARRARRPATGWASGRPTAPSGCCCSTRPRRSARSWSTSTRPTAATSSSYALRQSGVRCWSARESFKTSDYRAMIDEVAARPARRWSEVIYLGTPSGTRCSRPARPATRGRRRWPRRAGGAWPSTTRSTSSTPAGPPGFPKGATLSPPQHPQQRLLHRRGLPLHRAGPGLHPGAVLPLLRDGARQPGVHHARGLHRRSRRPASTRRRRCARCRTSGARRCTACRPCSSPSSRLPDFGDYDLSHAAHRHHGGLAVPGRGDEAGGQRDAHDRGDDLLRHDRDLAGLDPDHAPTTTLERRVVDRRPGAPARRGQDRRSGHRATVPRGDAGRALHARATR